MLILASGSARRREILDLFEVPYTIEESMIDEAIHPDEEPSAAVQRLATAKGASILTAHPGAAVLSADTVVGADDRILGKPADGEEARAMLEFLSGRSHTVYTGIALQRNGEHLAEVAEARVQFRDLAPIEIDAYLASGEPFGKAGAYAVQGLGGSLVGLVEGEVSTVVGLTISVTSGFLNAFGITHALNMREPSGGRIV
jgi:septum formation protein